MAPSLFHLIGEALALVAFVGCTATCLLIARRFYGEFTVWRGSHAVAGPRSAHPLLFWAAAIPVALGVVFVGLLVLAWFALVCLAHVA